MYENEYKVVVTFNTTTPIEVLQELLDQVHDAIYVHKAEFDAIKDDEYLCSVAEWKDHMEQIL